MEQRSEEWFEARRGKITGTVAWRLLGSDAVIKELAIEKYAEAHSTCDLSSRSINSPDVNRGIEEEGGVRARFEMEHNVEISEVGFIKKDDFCGCSPDGLIGEDGGIEIKCPAYKNHLKNMCNFIDKTHIAQMQWFMYCTGRSYCYFASYNEDFKIDLVVRKIEPDQEWLEKMEKGLAKYKEYLKEIDELLKGE